MLQLIIIRFPYRVRKLCTFPVPGDMKCGRVSAVDVAEARKILEGGKK